MIKQKEYDFAIIGSGIGGLVTALILAKNGYKVIVLEKNHQIGGALQVFSRDKCVFDTGVHYIGGLDKGENLYQIFKYLGIYDDLKLKSLDRDCFDLIRLNSGKIIPHGQGYANFIERLTFEFPTEKPAIESFCAKIQEICSYFPLYNLESEGEKTYYTHPEILGIGAWDFVSSITENNDLKIALLGSGILYAGDAKTTPMYVVALIMNSFIKGSYRLVDGGSQLAKGLVKQLRAHGGEIEKHKVVISADVNEQKNIQSLQCADGSSYIAKNYISSLHPSETIRIIGKEHFLPAFTKRIARLPNSVSCFMVNISLKENTFPYLNKNYYDYFTEDGWNVVDYDKESWPQVMYTCTSATSKSEEFAESISVMTYMSKNEVDAWSKSFNTVASQSERGEAYEGFKRDKEQKVIERLESRFPGIKKCIKNVYSSTPLTYKDYLGTPEGELYGIIKDFNHPTRSIINTKTKVNNLYLTGQNIVFHGILGATIGAFVTSFNFVENKNIIAQIKSHE